MKRDISQVESPTATNKKDSKREEVLACNLHKLNAKLFTALLANKSSTLENVVYSPTSILMALSMIMMGALWSKLHREEFGEYHR